MNAKSIGRILVFVIFAILLTVLVIYFTRPTLADYIKHRADLVHSASEVFRLLQQGVLSVNINQRMPLSDIVEAHRMLEAGSTTGSTILLP